MRLGAGAATDVGLVRANNQDQMLLASPIFAVADGMGGHAAGEVASLTAVDALRDAFGQTGASAEGVVEAARAANRAVWDAAQAHAELHGMGTTLTAIALVPDTAGPGQQLAVVNVGDSRTYVLHAGALAQVTVDHSYVAELVAEGKIDEAEAEIHPQRHVLTRALGVSPEVDVDLLVREPVPGDRYLLCSDGLSREVSDDQVASTLRRLADPGEAARELVTAAKRNGGSDNITVVVVDILGDEPDGPGGSKVHADGSTVHAGADDPTEGVAAGTLAPGADLDKPTVAVPLADLAADPPTQAVPAVTPGAATGTTAPGAELPPAVGDEPAPGRRERRRAAKAAAGPRARLVTVRVVAFLVLLLAILAVAGFGTEYYARSTYYVGLSGGRVTIFQGRPGGVLWWKPTVSEVTPVGTSGVLAYHLPALRSGVQESSLSAARAFVTSLRTEKAGNGATGTAGNGTTTATTVAP